MWKRLIHPNIVPLIGITLKPLQLISAWMPGGELKDYIAKNPNTNRLRLVGVPLLLCPMMLTPSPSYLALLTVLITSTAATWSTAISRGCVIFSTVHLTFLLTSRQPNILVDDAGCPRITDFGLAMVAQNQDSIRSAQGDHGHTARWTSPEILIGEGTYSKEADLFSFAMVMVEVCC